MVVITGAWAVAQSLWHKIEQPLKEIGGRMTVIEERQAKQAIEISFLQGVQSERQKTAEAAVVAAALVSHPLSEMNPHTGP